MRLLSYRVSWVSFYTLIARGALLSQTIRDGLSEQKQNRSFRHSRTTDKDF